MRISDIEFRCYETYYYANVVRNILSDQFAYVRHLNDFYGDGKEVIYSSPYERFSALHSFVSFVVEDLMFADEELDLGARQERAVTFDSLGLLAGPPPWVLPIESALSYYGLTHASFADWLAERNTTFNDATADDVCEYHDDLRLEGPVEKLLDRVVDEVFFVLFGNRRLLLLFNDMMARQIRDTDLGEVPEEYSKNFAQSGVLLRVTPPKWVKRAVFFRDRGRCVACRADLSGTLSTMSEEEYDHIVPLADGGLNDVTNIQLLCRTCNRRKRDGDAVTSDFYEAWYERNIETAER
jgi:HNH endonuclease